MAGRRRPTIVDVAQEAGVSRSLVSLVLQNPSKVSDARRSAVHEAMQRLGYQPNAAARSLVRSRTDTVGVLISDLHNPFYTEVIDGIEQMLSQAGYRMLIATGSRDPERERAAASTFIELRTEGIIMITPTITNAQISEVGASVPVTVVGRPGEKPAGCSRVYTDDAAGIRLAIEHLLALGHRRIAHVSTGDNPGGRARESAYRSAMAGAGLVECIRVEAEAPNQDGGYRGTRALLAADPQPTAVIATNDFAALGVLAAIADAGLDCPRDISVIGYDNSVFAQLQPVMLTTVNQPRILMGETAATLLHGLRKGEEPTSVALEPQLVVRDTSGSVPVG